METWQFFFSNFPHLHTNCTYKTKGEIFSNFLFLLSFFCREFRRQSCDWFYSHVQKRFQNFGSAKVIKSVGFTRKSFLFLNGVCLIYVLLSHIYYHYLKELNEKSITKVPVFYCLMIKFSSLNFYQFFLS